MKEPGSRLIRVVITDSTGAVSEATAQVQVQAQEAAQASGSAPPPPAARPPATTALPSGTNLALAANGATARQSSTYFGSCQSGPGGAIDGITDGRMCPTPVSHTDSENRPWWRVDLSAVRTIDRIVIWNRTDVAAERLSNFTVSVLDGAGKSVFSKSIAGHPNPSVSIPVPGVAGRSVQVQLNGANYLQLAEVQVFGR